MVGLLPAVSALPSGLNTALATGGAPLSQGQTAQLAVARALLRGPRLLILDETLDRAVGTAGFETLLDNLFERTAPWTLIVATSREEILARCGRVAAIQAGVVEAPVPVRVQ
jgi:ATP-binding cassette subfamily B protein